MAYTPLMAAHNPYDLRTGNAFRLLTGADACMQSMLEAIAHARRYVLFEQYLVSSGKLADEFIEAFSTCAQRRIPVYMLLDHFGSRGLNEADRLHLREAGVHLSFYNPAYLTDFFRGLPRNHGKMLLIDGEAVYTGGAGITDDYLAKQASLPWHDVMVEMRGPIAADWQHMFAHTWQHWGGELDVPPAETREVGEQCGRLAVSQRGIKKFIRKSLLHRISHSADSVWLATAYWLPGRSMLRALRAASRRGTDVRLLLPGPINDHPAVYHAGRRYYHYLLRNDIRIFEYQPAFMHAKLYLCDRWCSIGSCNMDRWGLRWNLEANLESSDPALCAELDVFFDSAFAQAREITLHDWLERPLGNRFKEWLTGYMDLMIERFAVNLDIHRKGGSGAQKRPRKAASI